MTEEFKPISEREAVEKIFNTIFSSDDEGVKLIGSNIVRDNLLKGRLTPKTGEKSNN